MNERIKELAEQATDKWVGGEFFDREKFAELIIQECADIADMNTHQWDLPGKYIIQHFGVKE